MKGEHRADIWVGDGLAGAIYDDGKEMMLATRDERVVEGGKYAFRLPFQSRPYQFRSLDPYFANLLPEGRRLSVLKSAAKRSFDDELGLLLAVGQDLIGDTAVVEPGQKPYEKRAESRQAPKLHALSFGELFEQSLFGSGQEGRASIPGVQDKLSDSMISFPVRGGQFGQSILKLNTEKHCDLVENEGFFLGMAKACGLIVSPFQIVKDREGQSGLLVKRFDRVKMEGRIRKLHVEDGCQLLGVYPRAKYDVTVRTLLEVALDVTKNPAVLATAVDHFAFHYLIADGDHHAKNFSVLEGADGVVTLAPAYDVLTTLPYQDQETALDLEGKDKNWKLRDFQAAWGRVGVSAVAVERRLRRLVDRAARWLGRLDELPFEKKQIAFLGETMKRRMDDLTLG